MATLFTKISGDNKGLSIPILMSVTDTIKSSGANKTNWIPIVTSTNTLTLFYISSIYIIMSGRGVRSPYCSGRGNGNRGGQVRGLGHNYSGASSAAQKGLYNSLGTSVSECSHNSAADQTRTSWKKLVQYVSTNYGQDISNGLQNKITVNLVEPFHTSEVTARHAIWEWIITAVQSIIQSTRATQRTILEAAVTAAIYDTDPMKLAILEN